MVDFRTGLDVIGTSFSAVPGIIPIKRPFNPCTAKLRAAYMLGSYYAQFSSDPIVRALGVCGDWSGGSRHILDWGVFKPESLWYLCRVSTAVPTTPFSANALIDDPDVGITLVAFHWADATAKAISLIRSLKDITTADPYISLSLQPQTLSGRVQAQVGNSGVVSSSLNPLPDELGNVALYAGKYTTASRTVYAQGPGVALKTGAPENTSKMLESVAQFQMGAETGAGGGLNRLIACAYYVGNLTVDELALVRADFGEWMTAVNSGLTIL